MSAIQASNTGPQMYGPEAKLAILCEGRFNARNAKTAYGMLRHAPNDIVAIIDSEHAGRTVREVSGIDRDTPIVASIGEAIALKPDVLVIGIAPTGGLLPEEWRHIIINCLTSGVDVAAGLHENLSEDPHFAELAEQHDRHIYDVRKPPRGLPVSKGLCRHLKDKRIVLVVGTDCNSGKMHVALGLEEELCKRGVKAKFVPTGQTGVFIKGWGIAIDNVISDFTAGAAELVCMKAAQDADVILVEGQGSLLHPGFSSVTLGLIHGSMPTDMVFCHPVHQVAIEQEYGLTRPSMTEMIDLHEHVVKHTRPAKVQGIAVNTSHLNEDDAQRVLRELNDETGLPTTDVVRYGCANIADRLMPA